MNAPRRRRVAAAIALMVGLPIAAFEFAPSAHADSSGSSSSLGGFNVSATATGMDIAPLTPGFVGAGDVNQGDLVEAAVPYSAATSTTGPMSTATSSPAYPGVLAAALGNALGTFAPQFPPAFLSALNDPVQAQAAYPPGANTASNDSYSPPGAGQAGFGVANAHATDSGAEADSATNDTGPGQQAPFEMGSATTKTTTTVGASSVTSTAQSTVSSVTLMGQIVIAGITSSASAVSDGTSGRPTSDFKIGSVTVAGQPAYIDGNGIHLAGQTGGLPLGSTANSVLGALDQAGIAVRTVSPAQQVQGSSAMIDSGALVISYFDQQLPNPTGALPVSGAGLNVFIGLSQATADATVLAAINFGSFGAFGSGTGPGSIGSTTAGSGSGGLPAASAVSPGPVTPSASGLGGNPAVSSAPSAGSSQPAGNSSGTGFNIQPAATAFGLPVKVSWVIVAILLSIVASGPLLGYANWQLLRGRRS